ncbi:LysR substrate-binding domain-containing protein [Cohnella faecalis]|nr:LysR substrate-binding domain-containing protein [Cohnella faecalis]
MYIAVGAGHPLANTASVAPERLSEQTWLVREIGSGTRAATEGMFAEFGIHPSG